MAESFNNFFTPIGTNLQKKISPTRKRFTNFLKRPNPENPIITHIIADEIGNLINLFESSKSVHPYSIPTKIMKLAKGTISSALSRLINNCIPQEIFANIYE